MSKRSYVWKISIPYLIILLLTLLSISLFLANYFQDFVETSWKKDLTDQARLYGQLTAPLIEAGPPYDSVNTLINSNSTEDNARVTTILPDGQVIAENEYELSSMENHLTRPEFQTALTGVTGTDIRTSATLGTRMLYVAVPINHSGKIVAVSRLAVSLSTLDSSIQQVRTLIFILSGSAILIVILLTMIYSLRKGNPLTRLTRTVEGLGRGELKDIGLSSRRDEIGTLASAFYNLTDQLNNDIEDLKNERVKLSAILANMSDGAILVDAGGYVSLINPAARHLFKFFDPLTTTPHTLIEIAREHEIIDLWRVCRSTGQQKSVTLETPYDREYIQVIGTDFNRSIPGMTLLLFQNLTTIRKLETVRRDFVSNVSHELRTPLASLKALTETLQTGALNDPPVAQRFLSQMDEEIDNLTQMVQELLELSRIESGKVPMQKNPILPMNLIEPAIKRMGLQAERAKINLVVTYPDDLPQIEVDATRLQQVLVNLIHNAIKFTTPNGTITIGALVDKSTVVFSVKDTGTGIPSDELDRIFERFYKGDRARSSGGTGLGLSICRHLVEAHGGKIWAESRLGEGSTFYFSIPVIKDPIE